MNTEIATSNFNPGVFWCCLWVKATYQHLLKTSIKRRLESGFCGIKSTREDLSIKLILQANPHHFREPNYRGDCFWRKHLFVLSYSFAFVGLGALFQKRVCYLRDESHAMRQIKPRERHNEKYLPKVMVYCSVFLNVWLSFFLSLCPEHSKWPQTFLVCFRLSRFQKCSNLKLCVLLEKAINTTLRVLILHSPSPEALKKVTQ